MSCICCRESTISSALAASSQFDSLRGTTSSSNLSRTTTGFTGVSSDQGIGASDGISYSSSLSISQEREFPLDSTDKRDHIWSEYEGDVSSNNDTSVTSSKTGLAKESENTDTHNINVSIQDGVSKPVKSQPHYKQRRSVQHSGQNSPIFTVSRETIPSTDSYPG